MAGKSRHPHGRTGSSRPSNVIDLRPRQWLETLDDLVPIGGPAIDSSAAEGAGTAPGGRDQLTPGGTTSAPPGSWAAADFWGEGAANVHDALQAPTHTPPSTVKEPAHTAPEPEPAGAPERPRRRHQPPPPPHRDPVPPSPLERAKELVSQLRSHRLTVPAAVLALAISLAVLAAAVTSSALGGATTTGSRTSSSRNATQHTDLASQAARVAQMFTPADIPPLAQPRQAHTRSAVRTPKTAAPSKRTHARVVSSAGGERPTNSGSTSAQPASPTTAAAASQASAPTSGSPAPSRPTGPSGPVSLIGAGTTPSG